MTVRSDAALGSPESLSHQGWCQDAEVWEAQRSQSARGSAHLGLLMLCQGIALHLWGFAISFCSAGTFWLLWFPSICWVGHPSAERAWTLRRQTSPWLSPSNGRCDSHHCVTVSVVLTAGLPLDSDSHTYLHITVVYTADSSCQTSQHSQESFPESVFGDMHWAVTETCGKVKVVESPTVFLGNQNG